MLLKNRQKTPLILYAVGVVLAGIWWVVLDGSKLHGVVRDLYGIFLPIAGTPWMFWVVHKEGQEPAGYFKENYAGHPCLMWAVRVFIMVAASIMMFLVALLVLGVVAFVRKWLGVSNLR
jgi:hypothetical protein